MAWTIKYAWALLQERINMILTVSSKEHLIPNVLFLSVQLVSTSLFKFLATFDFAAGGGFV